MIQPNGLQLSEFTEPLRNAPKFALDQSKKLEILKLANSRRELIKPNATIHLS